MELPSMVDTWHSHCLRLQMGQAEPINHSVTKIFKGGGAAHKAENLQWDGLQAESVQWEGKQMDRKRQINRQIHAGLETDELKPGSQRTKPSTNTEKNQTDVEIGKKNEMSSPQRQWQR